MSANDLPNADLSAVDAETTPRSGHAAHTRTTAPDVGERQTAEYAAMRRVMNRFA